MVEKADEQGTPPYREGTADHMHSQCGMHIMAAPVNTMMRPFAVRANRPEPTSASGTNGSHGCLDSCAACLPATVSGVVP